MTERKPPRPSQEQRSELTRERLIRATIDCISEKGYANATTAEISERAGVSSGARVHHFKTKLDLVVAVIHFTYRQATEDSLAAAASAEALADPLAAYIADAYQLYSEQHFLIQHEVIHAARTNDELLQFVRPAALAYRAAVNAAWLDTFVRAGHSKSWSQRAMDLTAVIVRGLALSSFIHGRQRDAEILGIWQEVMARHPEET